MKFDQKSLSYTKFHKRQNDRKGWYTIFGKSAKKDKNEVKVMEKHSY